MSVSHNNCCNRKPISRSVYCWVTRNCQQYKNIERCTKCLYGELTPPEQWTLLRSSSKMPRYFCLISIWNFSTDFHETSQYQILQKSVQSKAYTCGQTDRHIRSQQLLFFAAVQITTDSALRVSNYYLYIGYSVHHIIVSLYWLLRASYNSLFILVTPCII